MSKKLWRAYIVTETGKLVGGGKSLVAAMMTKPKAKEWVEKVVNDTYKFNFMNASDDMVGTIVSSTKSKKAPGGFVGEEKEEFAYRGVGETGEPRWTWQKSKSFGFQK